MKQAVLKQTDSTPNIRTPTQTEVLRYRYHHGTNLGSIFVLEQWLSPSMFVSGGSSELDAVQASLSRNGLDGTRGKWEDHWRNAVSADDWNWLVNAAHCTTIRLPIGFFTLGPNFCTGTPFEGTPAQVYINAWSAVKGLVASARSRGIGVLLDLHAVPGGANGGSHSGTSSGHANLWGNQYFLDLARRCLVFMAQEARLMDGVVGLQLCNEADTNANGMYAWYDSVIAAIAPIDGPMPIYISDGWNLGAAVNYINGKNTIGNWVNPIVIDTHIYYTFSDSDKQQSPQQIINRVGGELGQLNGHQGSVVDHGAAQVIVGEYSCVLDPQTWSKADPSQKGQLILDFGRAQSRTWQSKAGGSCFWTYKMDWMDGGEWGFAQQTKSSAITPPPSLLLSSSDVQSRMGTARSQQADRKNAAVSAHVAYWAKTSPGQTFEHWRYENGWDVGFSDAMAFFGMRASGQLVGPGGDKIAMLDLWALKRIKESGQGGSFVWEFEQGLRQGISDFYGAVGV